MSPIYTIRELANKIENPSLGKKRDDVKTGYYCFPQGKHLIFYTIAVNGIDVIGIPHQSMDIVDYLG